MQSLIVAGDHVRAVAGPRRTDSKERSLVSSRFYFLIAGPLRANGRNVRLPRVGRSV